MAEIQRVRYTHEAIAEFLVTNPTVSQGEIAKVFGYSESWLSQVINSDAFQAYYRKLADERGALATHTVAAKIAGFASLALDKAMEKLETGSSERFITDSTEQALRALGYLGGNGGPPAQAQGPQQHMHIHVDAEALTEARERAAAMLSATVAPAPAAG